MSDADEPPPLADPSDAGSDAASMPPLGESDDGGGGGGGGACSTDDEEEDGWEGPGEWDEGPCSDESSGMPPLAASDDGDEPPPLEGSSGADRCAAGAATAAGGAAQRCLVGVRSRCPLACGSASRGVRQDAVQPARAGAHTPLACASTLTRTLT